MSDQAHPQPSRHGPAAVAKRAMKVGWSEPTRFTVPIPKNEKGRVAALQRYNILDTPPEKAFDLITQMAAQICQTPVAMLSLVDSDRQWFKSKVGIEMTETPRATSFCAHAIMRDKLFVIPDALADKRFAASPLVTSEPHIRFYAGAPLVAPTHHVLGTLCVVDRVPRQLSPEQLAALCALSRQVIELLEMRREVLRLRQQLLEQCALEGHLKQRARRAEAANRTQEKFLQKLRHEVHATAQGMMLATTTALKTKRAPSHASLFKKLSAGATHLLKLSQKRGNASRSEGRP